MTARQGLALVVAALLMAAVAPGGVAAHGDHSSQIKTDAFLVALNEDGSAKVTLQLTYSLDSDEERAAFEDLKNNETLQKQTKRTYRNRLQRVAASAENETGRKMAIENVAIAFATTDNGSTGLVKLSVRWVGLAATKGDKLVVTEPFASGFEPNRTFVVTGPKGYQIESVTPTPDKKQANRAVWDAGSNLSGFEAVFAPAGTPTPTASPTDGGGPGFGVLAGLLALAGGTLAVGRRN